MEKAIGVAEVYLEGIVRIVGNGLKPFRTNRMAVWIGNGLKPFRTNRMAVWIGNGLKPFRTKNHTKK